MAVKLNIDRSMSALNMGRAVVLNELGLLVFEGSGFQATPERAVVRLWYGPVIARRYLDAEAREESGDWSSEFAFKTPRYPYVDIWLRKFREEFGLSRRLVALNVERMAQWMLLQASGRKTMWFDLIRTSDDLEREFNRTVLSAKGKIPALMRTQYQSCLDYVRSSAFPLGHTVRQARNAGFILQD